ncbi:LOW QUALITY PROTEIN: uncharacterized protein LOC135196147 [Macrobrachium nipponense]|uniref:LOW QUALITY PROTEIN: uncharacterized protein LOC135196147 n=1 Tax=Macrobrachium nipponense TaxID=159736 RepID=UPI0030C81CBF
MESGARSLLPDRMEGPKPHFPIRLDDSATSMLPDRGKSPLTLAIDATTTQLNSVAESFKTHFPHGTDGTKSFLLQNLEGTMALLAARGVDAPYPIALDGLRPFLPYGSSGESVKSYLLERLDKPHKSVRDRKDIKCSGSDRTTTTTSSSSVATSVGGDIKRFHHHHHHDRSREHKSSNSHSIKKVPLPKSQLSNPRHDANLTHAIRELHDEEFGLDAVLLAEGGHVGAHCAVLAAASPFLKTILLHANDHPAIISVTGTSFSTLQSLVTCLYTGNIPSGASLFHLIEAAKLLKMDELAAVLQKTYFAQGGSLDLPPKSQQLISSSQRSTTTTTASLQQGLITSQEQQPEKFGKKVRSNRLDQILYQKLNVNHLAPSDIPEQPPPHPPPSLVPPSQESSRVPPLFDASRVPILEAPRVPPPDHGGILGELLTKADPLRSIFSNPSIYSGIPDLSFEASRASTLKPLNLSKSSKAETLTSSAASTVSSSTCTTTAILSSTTTSCSPSSTMASSLASQTDLTLAGLTSLAPTLPGNMPGLLTPLTPSNISSMISPSALVSLSTTSALASFGAQHSAITSKPKSSCGNGTSRSRSTTKSICSGRSSSSSSTNTTRPGDNSGTPSHSLPLLYTLRSGMMTPEMAKEVYEQLKINPQLSTLAGFNINSIPNLASLSSSASLQNLANLHNLSSLQSFPTIFPFLASATENSQINTVESSGSVVHDNKVITLSPTEPPSNDYNVTVNSTSVNANNLSSSVMTAEDGVLNLSSSAQTVRSESPGVTTSVAVVAATSASTEEATIQTSDSVDQPTVVNVSPSETKEEQTDSSPPEVTNVSTGCQTVGLIDPPENCGTVVVASSDLNCTLSNGCSVSEETKASILSGQLDPSNLPLLLMTSNGPLTSISQTQTNIVENIETTPDVQAVLSKDPSLMSSEGADTGDDTSSIEVVDEIPGISQALQNRKAMFHAGHMGRKRKGCGDCEGCQVVEDCGQCRFCRDKAKFGGPNRLKQVCVYKRCVHAELEPEDSKKKRKSSGKKGRGKCGGCDGCQRTTDCNECYACLHNAATQPPARRKVCEMRVCEQQQMEEVRATLSVAGEPSPYSTDSLMAEGIISSGTSSPTPDGQPSTHNDKMKLMRKMLKKKFAQPYSRVSPSKVRTKYYCGECPGCQTTTPCGNCLYCEDMPKFGGPGRYRQKCVKQLCVYHPRLQALKLSNRSKITYDEQHILPETLNHLGGNVAIGHEEPIVIGCDLHPNIKSDTEFDHLRAMENVETDLTEGEDSNAALHVETILEELPIDKQGPIFGIEHTASENLINPETVSDVCPSPTKMEENDDSDDTPTVVTSNPEPVLPVVVDDTDTLDSTPQVIAPPTETIPTPEPVCESPPPTATQPPLPTYCTLPMPSVSETNTAPVSVPSDSDVNVVAVSNIPTPPAVRSPTPTDHKEGSGIDIEVEELEEDVDDDDDEAGSDASDVPSPPSTPSPPARSRGRGRQRGRGRPQGKTSRHLTTSAKKEKVMRRGRRRRTTRFTLEPDDNSDFEDQLAMSDIQDENSTEGSVGGSQLAEGVQSDTGASDATQEVSPVPLSPETTQKQNYSQTFVGRPKSIEPDVFEFHDSQENVITNSHETTYSLKHNTPFVFRDEESSQGGRDVNENLGSVGETASA